MTVDLSQLFSGDNTLLLVLGCACLCVVGFILMSGLHIVGGVIGTFSSVIDVVFNILSGGPVSWCGCLVLIFVCIGGVGGAYVITQAMATCGTPQAINLCRLFGR